MKRRIRQLRWLALASLPAVLGSMAPAVRWCNVPWAAVEPRGFLQCSALSATTACPGTPDRTRCGARGASCPRRHARPVHGTGGCAYVLFAPLGLRPASTTLDAAPAPALLASAFVLTAPRSDERHRPDPDARPPTRIRSPLPPIRAPPVS